MSELNPSIPEIRTLAFLLLHHPGLYVIRFGRQSQQQEGGAPRPSEETAGVLNHLRGQGHHSINTFSL